MKALRRRGVDTTIGYMSDLSGNPLFAEYAKDCPNAARIHAECLHIPVHPNLRQKDLDHMIEAVRAATLEANA
jgi:dTDP-4-amino-4,6-dideoxygalactose transaminase